MPAYICVSHALSRREETDVFCRGLSRYGFRFACIHEQTDPQHREETLTEASLLIALTCPAAEAAETVASDIRRAMGRSMPVLCVSMKENGLDHRFCSPEGGAALIPAPAGDMPDRRTVSLFIHRLFIRHLSRLPECFSPVRCVEDTYGKVVAAAVAAHSGNTSACYVLGRAYEEGDGVPQLEVEAAHWIALAAEGGVSDARIRMGEMYLAGRGIERDPEAAFRLFEASAREGDVRGEYCKGICYLRGWGVLKDPERACECLKKASDEGYAPASYQLGLLYQNGEGVCASHRAAVSLIHTACLQMAEAEDLGTPRPPPHPGARGGMAVSCVTMRQLRRTRLKDICLKKDSSHGRMSRDQHEDGVSARAFARSRVMRTYVVDFDRLLHAEEADHTESARTPEVAEANAAAMIPVFSMGDAATTLGRLLTLGAPAEGICPHPTAALAWYRYAIRRGSISAAYDLGDAYRRGYGIPADPERAFSLFRLAADRGDERGLFALGVCYEQGLGKEPDPYRAFSNYERSAQAGYAPAQNNLGGCYEYGLGVVRDMTVAAEWYARAAAELPEAACRLGLCYEYGRGVETDMAKAIQLYETATEGGDPYAAYRLGLCYDRGIRPGEQTAASDGEGEVPVASPVSEHLEKVYSTAFDYGRATRLFEIATEGGVADAAYALSLCYARGRGVRRDEVKCLAYMNRAADGGCVAANFSLGLYHLEGQALVRNVNRAVSRFANAAALWEEKAESARYDVISTGILALAGLTDREAAGAALYMLGYCTLYSMGDSTNPAVYPHKNGLSMPQRVELAAAYFERAAQAEHMGALTALGDLYVYGMRTPTAAISAEAEAQNYYMEAVRVGQTCEYRSADSGDSPIDALMSLAERSIAAAEAASAEGDEGTAELARVHTWRMLASASEEGSMDATVAMAACAYHGYGTPQSFQTARWFLDKAAHTEEGRVTASLWLGDLYYAGKEGDPSPALADQAYLHAISIPDTVSECGEYSLRERRAARAKQDRAARAEACYRLAALRAVHFADGEDVRESFSYLARAILMGHAAARDDLARMYAFEASYVNATAPQSKRHVPAWLAPSGLYARHRLRSRDKGSVTRRDARPGRSHEGWMNNYYTALWPEPAFFALGMRATSSPVDRPAYVSAEVTPAMTAAALNYLGDCLFFGKGLPEDPTSAAACYKEAADMQVPDREAPVGQVWAQYSYGWCLLYGVGVREDPRAAVRYLTRASKTHAEACYTLGECYEIGLGVDGADPVEAYKFYRKAVKLGYDKAQDKVRMIEKNWKKQRRKSPPSGEGRGRSQKAKQGSKK